MCHNVPVFFNRLTIWTSFQYKRLTLTLLRQVEKNFMTNVVKQGIPTKSVFSPHLLSLVTPSSICINFKKAIYSY
jgi:hypothetical protein